MIANDSGQIAVKYYQTIPKQVTVGGKLYIFGVQANISLAWVDPEHVDGMLATLGGCCGQKKSGVFKLCNEDDVRRWTFKGGR